MNHLRLLYSSNAFWAKSGYGVQGASLLPRLAELDTIGGRENISQFAWYGLQGGMHNVEGFTVYPGGMDPYGNDIIGQHSKHFGANIVITLIDAWVMDKVGTKVKPALWYPWIPVDHLEVPEKVLEGIADADLVLSYSRDGEAKLSACGIDNVYIPHGLETSQYLILPEEKRFLFRDNLLNRPNSHLSIMVAANKGFPDRKAFQVQLRAWAEFAKDKPDAILYLHTERTPMYGGLNLDKLCAKLGIGNKVFFPDRYENFLGFDTGFLTHVYNSANILMAAGMGEGFGIPIIESQACGTPVIVTNGTSMPELVRYGVITEPRDIFYTPMETWQLWPDVTAIKEALEENYQEWLDNDKQKDHESGLKAEEAIHAEFNWDTIVETYWQPLLKDAHSRVFKSQKTMENKSGKVLP